MINKQNSEVLSEYYVIIFLNKLKIAENPLTPQKIKIKRLWLRGRPFRDSRALSWLSGSRTNVPAEPPLIGLGYSLTNTLQAINRHNLMLFHFL